MKPIDAQAERQRASAGSMAVVKAEHVPLRTAAVRGRAVCLFLKHSAEFRARYAKRACHLRRALRLAAHVVSGATAVSLSACNATITRNVDAVVLQADGNVSVTMPVGPSADVGRGSRIAHGATFVTDFDAHSALSLLPGALIDVGPQSEVRILALKLTKNGNRIHEAIRREVRIALTRGVLTASIRFETDERGVVIETPHGSLSLNGPALFRIEARDAVTRVTCARGVVFFEPKDGANVTLEAPAFREWPAAEREAIPADFDVRAMEEIENSKEVEQKLLGLETRQRLSPFPWRH